MAEETTAAAATAAPTSNLAVVQRLYAAFETGDVEAIAALATDDLEWSIPGPPTVPFAGMFRGKEGIRRFFTIAVETLNVVEQRLDGFITDGDRVAALGYEDMQVKATGRHYRTTWVHLYTFRDGKIAKFEEFVDTAAQAAAFAP